eukprot:5431238-Amphidinium_carterae.1
MNRGDSTGYSESPYERVLQVEARKSRSVLVQTWPLPWLQLTDGYPVQWIREKPCALLHPCDGFIK